FAALLEAVARREKPAIGIVYPTEITEDLSMVRLYAELFAERGCRVALGSPYNLGRAPDGRLALLGTPVDVVVRHYKTDWLGEREPVWLDQAPPDHHAPPPDAGALPARPPPARPPPAADPPGPGGPPEQAAPPAPR